jgi:release factor glutamine methyltransferase
MLPYDTLIADLTPHYGAGEAASIARIVLEDAFGTRQWATYRLPDADAVARWEDIRARLRRLEPVQYVLGEADFFGLKFGVSPAVLIPRQETEELVAWVLEDIRAGFFSKKNAALRLLDVGIGSGCIGLSIARQVPDIQLFGLEVSADALAVAQDNARRLTGREQAGFRLADVLDTTTWPDLPTDLDVVVSNPPYIAPQEQVLMPAHVLDYEPHVALFAEGDDPLIFYRRIAQLAAQKLRPGGVLRFECNEFNATEVADWLRTQGWQSVECRADLSGALRMVGAVK